MAPKRLDDERWWLRMQATISTVDNSIFREEGSSRWCAVAEIIELRILDSGVAIELLCARCSGVQIDA